MDELLKLQARVAELERLLDAEREDNRNLAATIEQNAHTLAACKVSAEWWIVFAGEEPLEVFSYKEDAHTFARSQDAAHPDGAPHVVVRVVATERDGV